MSPWKSLAFASLSALLLSSSSVSPAQISINIGPAPGCPYGYFDYQPYSCAPYGYYGPDWFRGGRFVGAGPWFRGRSGFFGHVDNRYDPRRGYAGPMPDRGEQPFNHFHGNEARDGQGHTGDPGHDAGREHQGGYQGYHGDAGGRGGGDRGGGDRGGGRPH